MDAHGTVPHRGPSTFYHEQCFRRNDLVLPTCVSSHFQRYLCIYLRNHVRPNAAHQAFTQKDRRGLRGSFRTHDHLRRWHDQRTNALQILHLPSQCKSPASSEYWELTFPPGPRSKYMDGTRMHAQSGFHCPHLRFTHLVSPLQILLHGAYANTHPSIRSLCVFNRSIWRLLCLRTQTLIQDQGLWRLHPRSWRYDRSYGLSIHHGFLRIYVLS